MVKLIWNNAQRVVNDVRPKAVVYVVQGNNVNDVKVSACWVWKQKTTVLDHVSKHNSASTILKRNMSYLTDYEEIDGGYVNFRGNPKGGKITGKARTPQQNRVAERRNMTLIKAARTMLDDSKLPTIFWAEAVNTACCANFDGKADEGFFVGYTLNSKAFRVFNNRTRIMEENLDIRFSESTPNVAGSGPDWLFDIDALTRTVNYEPIVVGTQSNGFADPEESHDDGSKPSNNDGKKVDEDPKKDSESNDQEKEDNVNSTNNVNVASTNKVNVVGGKKKALNFQMIQICLLLKIIAYLTSQEIIKMMV
ncbi:ribonuclease H-like domain-containing protein [Tanacetum coccineum]